MVNRGLLTINKDAFQYITEHLEATSQMTLYKIMALYRILGEQGGAFRMSPADNILGDNTFVLK